MKSFKFGVLIEKEDICDRETEVQLLTKIASSPAGRAVIYGRRRFGKTSLIRNVIMKDFEEKKKKNMAIFTDLFQVDSIADFNDRIKNSLEQSLAKHAKIKTFLSTIQNYLKNLQMEMSIDSNTGEPKIKLAGKFQDDERSISDIFSSIMALSNTYSILIILDEFQDIVNVPTLESILRTELQKLSLVSVLLLGSKRHILKDIFQDERRPFYGFGTDIELGKIPRDKWFPYIRERFKENKLEVTSVITDYICETMDDVPNAIQELCYWIWIGTHKGTVTKAVIDECLKTLLKNKSSRYMEKFGYHSVIEKNALLAIAKKQPVDSVGSIDFLKMVNASATGVKTAFERLSDQGIIDKSQDGYRITDPLFRLFLLEA